MSPKDAHPDPLDLLDDLIGRARKAGADAADALVFDSATLSLTCRLGDTEKVERAESQELGLRVIVGRRQAVVSSTDFAPAQLDGLVERVLAMARSVPDDPHCGLADAAQIAVELPDLETLDAEEPSTETLEARARACEDAARAVPGVTNSDGAEAGWGSSAVALAASNGFRGAYRASTHSLAVAVLAGEGTAMERDYEMSTALFGEDLDDPEQVGRTAGERAVRRLNPRKVATAQVPVIYESRVSNGLVRHLAGAVNGAAIARGTSFLLDSMDQPVCAAGISIVDDPLRRRGRRSRPFDAEGLPSRRLSLVDRGVLKSWVLDLGTARQLGLESTANATRGTSSPPMPGTTNLYMEAGAVGRDAMFAEVGEGLLVTELMGMGINMVTGDYSRGAAGFWIENGEIAYPVSELTVAGNLKDMFRAMTAADDLEFRYGTDAPTVRVDGLTVAGQ